MKAGRRILESLGYRVVFRRHGWAECLAWRGQERWLGHGADESQALESVFAQMFPSSAARQLVERFDSLSQGTSTLDGQSPPLSTSTTGQEQRIYSRAEALEALENLAQRIDMQQPDLAMMVPLRQRMVMLAWICRARTWEDRRPGDSFVARQVATIARKITLLGKLWWPGSVRSLHVNSTPADAAAEADMDGTWPARTWSDASALVNDRIRRLFANGIASGRDPYGWRDQASLQPPPVDPNAQLKRIARELADRVGSLEEPARNGSRGGYTPHEGDYDLFSQWARELRWLRGSVKDFSTWGAAIGRLRWLALQNSPQRSSLGELLDPDFRPAQPWCEEVGTGRAETADADTPAPLVLAVRQRVEGLRALLLRGVSSGTDAAPVDGEQLEQTFGLSVADGTSEPGQMGDVLDQLTSDAVDLVILVTSFEDFDLDARLAAAARDAEVSYVRLYLPEALPAARALAHQMRLDLAS